MCLGVNNDPEMIRALAVGIDNIQIGQNEVKNEVKRSLMDISSRLEELEQRSYHPFGSNKVSVSPTSFGDTIMDSLIATKSFNRAVEGSGHQAIPDDLILEAQNMFKMPQRPHENILVNLYTPSLMEIVNNVSPDLRLVNSESYPWRSPSPSRSDMCTRSSNYIYEIIAKSQQVLSIKVIEATIFSAGKEYATIPIKYIYFRVLKKGNMPSGIKLTYRYETHT